jgi:RimJ/RimL family protein N-acetyltransferase
VLRPVRRADLPLLVSWLDDPLRFAEHDTPTRVPREDLERRLDETGYDAPELSWRLIRSDADDPVGLISASPGRGAGSVEIGFLIAEPSARGQGLARRAVCERLDELFADAGTREVVAFVHPDNCDSIRLLAGLGFEAVGTAPQHRMIRGHWVDFQIHALLRDAWRCRA